MPDIAIAGRPIGCQHPTYIIAELSANHGHKLDEALRLVHAAKDAGADAIKLQTYTPDTMTLNSNKPWFQIGKGTIWEGKNLYQLYEEAYTPWEWTAEIASLAISLGMHCFSTPFDASAVDYLEKLDMPAYKVASFEVIDLPLLKAIARTGRPVIMSTGMATLAEIDEAVATLRSHGTRELALLKCTSAYPSVASDMHLRTIPHLAQAFNVPVGLSDHTMDVAVPVAAVTLGARIIEKHLTMDRSVPGPDSQFSLEPAEFKAMVSAVRTTEQALGQVQYAVSKKEEASRVFRRSLFVVKDVKAGQPFTHENVRSIRPGYGLHPRYLDVVIGKVASQNIEAGTPLDWNLIG
jgi:pseudaminic acid synthase